MEEKLEGIKLTDGKKLPAIWNLIKTETEEAAVSSTIHGIGGVFRSKIKLLRVLWLAMLFASSAYCAYSILVSIQNYLEYEVVTNVYNNLAIPSEFPRVKICNKNPIQTEFGYNFSESQVDPLNIDMTSFTGVGDVVANQMSILTSAKGLLGNKSQNLGLTMEDMLIACWFPNLDCNVSSFVYSRDAAYGNCYSFNTGYDSDGKSQKIGKVTLAGLYNGLVMELYVGAPSNLYSFSGVSGVQIYVNNQTVYDSTYGGVSLPAGAFSAVEVSRVFTQNLPMPYSDCTSDDDIKRSSSKLVQMILSTGYDYKLKDCIDLCYQEYLIKYCNCQDGNGMTTFPNVPYCSNSSQSQCSFATYMDFYTTDVRSYCSSECPLECNNVDYILSVSSADYPSPSYYQYLINQSVLIKNFGNDTSAMTYENVKRNILGFSVHYGSLVYQNIETSSKTSLTDLVGQFGGFCGLFVGMSFMSFFEIIELGIVIVVRAIEVLFSHRKLKTIRVVPKEQSA